MGLIALDPPPEIKRVLESKIAELDTQLNSSTSASGRDSCVIARSSTCACESIPSLPIGSRPMRRCS